MLELRVANLKLLQTPFIAGDGLSPSVAGLKLFAKIAFFRFDDFLLHNAIAQGLEFLFRLIQSIDLSRNRRKSRLLIARVLNQRLLLLK